MKPEGYHQPLSTNKAITTRDRHDVKTSDLMIVNLMGVDKVSIGTCIEFGWADAYRVPVIALIEEDSIHWHGMLREIVGVMATDIEEAANFANVFLIGGTI